MKMNNIKSQQSIFVYESNTYERIKQKKIQEHGLSFSLSHSLQYKLVLDKKVVVVTQRLKSHHNV